MRKKINALVCDDVNPMRIVRRNFYNVKKIDEKLGEK